MPYTYEPFYWYNSDSKLFTGRDYLGDSPDLIHRAQAIADAAEAQLGIKGFSEKFLSNISKGWYSFASPIWTSYGNDRGLPISCFGSFIDDSMESIMSTVAEVGMMSKYGGGTSAYFGNLRARGAKINSSGGTSFGAVHFMQLFETVIQVVSQSNVRRGQFAAYLPIDHADIGEFLKMRHHSSKIHDLSFGVTVTDDWMQLMIDGDKDKQSTWAAVIQKRVESGYPYIFFSDTVNNAAPDAYKDNLRKIWASNLCSEIALSASSDESFVCNLSSMNLLHYEEWKDTDAVEILTFFLDAVMSEFISKSAKLPFMEKAHKFATNQRALGIGTLGYHSFLQSKMIGPESLEAKMWNSEMHRTISEKSLAASKKLASMFGEPPALVGYGRRNMTLMAIAPTTSSSFILGQVSPGIEFLTANYFVKKLAKGNFTYKNPYLKQVLASYNKDNINVWKSILINGGSVQHLEFLSEQEKDVFKTFGEISQYEVILQAGQRQKYIDQGQSLNLMIHPATSLKEINALIIHAWKSKVKALYYHLGTNPSQELGRSLMKCESCSG